MYVRNYHYSLLKSSFWEKLYYTEPWVKNNTEKRKRKERKGRERKKGRKEEREGGRQDGRKEGKKADR